LCNERGLDAAERSPGSLQMQAGNLIDWSECSFVALYAGQALADEVIAWLRERGLRLIGVYNMANDRDGRAVQADFLFGR
jgi:hypothetical protein